MRTYLPIIKAFLFTLLRPMEPGFYLLPKSPSLDKALDKLRPFVESKDRNLPGEPLMVLHNVFKELWCHTWPADTAFTFSDPTLVFLGMYNIRPTGEFNTPTLATPIIARITRLMQLFLLHEIHILVENGNAPTHENGYELVGKWLVHKHNTTFANLTSIQAFATALARSNISKPKLFWEDKINHTSLFYNGQKATLSGLQTMIHSLQAQAVEIWEHKICMGVKHLRIDWNILPDNLSNTAPDFSVLDALSDPQRNSDAKENLLLHTILNTPSLAAKALRRDTHRWSMVWIEGWLRSLAEFEGILLVLNHLSSGGPGRGPEICGLLARNLTTRDRNLIGMLKVLLLIRMYDKTTNLQQKDKFIPTAMDSFTTDMVLQLHLIARPLACYLATLAFPQDLDAVRNYRTLVFTNYRKPFTSEKLTNLLGDYSVDHLGWKLSLSVYRHIFIAFNRKHNGQLYNLIESEDDMTTTAALMTGHTRHTDVSVYGLTQDSLLGVSEDAMELYVAASQAWQRTMHIVPAGEASSYWKLFGSQWNLPPPKPSPKDQQIIKLESRVSELATKLDAGLDQVNGTLAAMLKLLQGQVSTLQPANVEDNQRPDVNVVIKDMRCEEEEEEIFPLDFGDHFDEGDSNSTFLITMTQIVQMIFTPAHLLCLKCPIPRTTLPSRPFPH